MSGGRGSGADREKPGWEPPAKNISLAKPFPDESGCEYSNYLTEIKSAGKIQALFHNQMGLEAFGRAGFDSEAFDGRQMELMAEFDVSGDFALDPYGPPENWEAQKLAYGQEVATKVADQAVAQMATIYGVPDLTPPAASISARNSLNGRWNIGWADENALDIRQRIGGVFRLSTDRDLEPGELILAARDQIAMAVADLAVFALEQRFEGKQENNAETGFRRENGNVVEFRRRNVPPPPPDGDTQIAA